MELDIYSVIKRPHVTSKAYGLNQRKNQLVLEVHPQANKPMVAEALKKLFNVEADSIRIVVVKGRTRRVGRREVVGNTRKKAYISLKKGVNVDLMGWSRPGETERPVGNAQQG